MHLCFLLFRTCARFQGYACMSVWSQRAYYWVSVQHRRNLSHKRAGLSKQTVLAIYSCNLFSWKHLHSKPHLHSWPCTHRLIILSALESHLRNLSHLRIQFGIPHWWKRAHLRVSQRFLPLTLHHSCPLWPCQLAWKIWKWGLPMWPPLEISMCSCYSMTLS